jgi:hypothetical protein
MDELTIIREFKERSQTARKYRTAAAVFLAVSILLLTLSGIDQPRIGAWGGLLLAAGLIFLVLSLAAALISFIELKCPSCSRVLGEVWGPVYCPSCGAALKSDADPAAPVPSKAARGKRAGAAGFGMAARRRNQLTVWEPKVSLAEYGEHPGEAYPKNIRLFTTTDEGELTKRYIRLIHKDDLDRQEREEESSVPPTGEPLRKAGSASPDPEAGTGEKNRWPKRNSRRANQIHAKT